MEPEATQVLEGSQIRNLACKKNYIYGQVSEPDKNSQIMVKITVDSGNNVRNSVAIREEFRKKIGAKFCSLKENTIKTAGEENLTQLGECWVSIKIKGFPKVISKANVLKELKDNINVGTAFMQRLASKSKTSLEFTKDGTILRHGKA